MKAIEVVPCFEPGYISLPDIPLFRYTPKLNHELNSGIITKSESLKIYRLMILLRNFEYMVRDLSKNCYGALKDFEFRGSSHLSVGQEAASVGAMSVLSKHDYITSNHRGHGHCISKGIFALYQMNTGELRSFLKDANDNQFDTAGYEDALNAAIDYHLFRIIAELLGKDAGYCRGRGGSMHIADSSSGNLGANAIVGGSMAIAAGAALTIVKQKQKKVVVCCIGDGAMNNGISHEALNFSSMAQFQEGIPVIFFIENNQYGYTCQQRGEITGVEYLSQRGAGYNKQLMHAETVCGMNILSVRDAIKRARGQCLNGTGPVLVEASTYRYYGHNYKDKGASYRTEKEKKAWEEYDPVSWFKNELIENGILSLKKADEEWRITQRKIEMIVSRAAKCKDPGIEDMYFGLYAESNSNEIGDKYKTVNLLNKPRKIPRDSSGKILARHAVLEALMEEMIRDERVVIWGEDVAGHGGAYKTTLGLLDIFGENRIFNTAISESAIVGTGIGAAMTGLRPVVEIMYIDFMLQAMDQVANQAAKTRFIFSGQYKIPLTIRTTIGGGKGYAGQHSQSLEAIIAHIPGIKVVIPSNAYDLKGLLKTAIRDDNPVIFIEHQQVYLEKGLVPAGEEYTIPFGKANILRTGQDVTVIAYSFMAGRVLAAAEILEKKDGVRITVIDPRTLVPLDMKTISDSVNETGRAVIVVQANYTGSFASHIAHEIMCNCFKNMKCPVRIIASYDIPPPMAYPLERENMPNVDRIISGIKRVLAE